MYDPLTTTNQVIKDDYLVTCEGGLTLMVGQSVPSVCLAEAAPLVMYRGLAIAWRERER